jgi:hypothetical protein
MEQGNNIECFKTFRMEISLFNEQGNGQPGQKYFFPDNPIFKGKNIVGIDCNLQEKRSPVFPFPAIELGDLSADNYKNLGALMGIQGAQFIYCTIYDEDNTERFYNVPLRSFFMQPSVIVATGQKNPRRVKPYSGKINPRKSFLFIPPGVATFGVKSYVSLTFYYN